MPFNIDEDTLMIKGRQGDTASFTFNFNQDISAYTVKFYVKKNLNKDTSVIEKDYENPETQAVTVNLTASDTQKLTSQPNSYSIYYWGLKIMNGNNFVQTIIPKEFKTAPLMYVYPEIGD